MKDYLLSAFIIGVGATIAMDVWGIARKRLLGIAGADYALVGRWLGWMTGGRFRHESIASATPVRHERLIGWTAHYLIGILFAGVLLVAYGTAWIDAPTIIPALLIVSGTVTAPFLLMQPGMGAGIAASRTPRPAVVRVQSLITHAVFGFGL